MCNAYFHLQFLLGLGSSTRLFELIHSQPSIPTIGGLEPEASQLTGNITLSNVKFSYPTRSDIEIFKDLSLNVTAGE